MKKWTHYLPEIIYIGISLFIGLIGGLLTNMGIPAYEAVQKPWFTPPSWVFPIVWSILYILMGYAMAKVSRTNSPLLTNCLSLFGIQLLLNLFWSVWFFLLQWYGFAFLWLLVLLIAVVAMAVCFYRLNKVAGLLQIPYVLWLMLAASLNYGVWMLN